MNTTGYIKDFVIAKHTEGVSVRYVNMVKRCVKEFAAYMEVRGISKPDEITMQQLKEYELHLSIRPLIKREGTMSSSMIRHNLNSVKYFYQYLVKIEAIEENPMSSYEVPVAISEKRIILDKEEVTTLLNVCETYLEKAIILLAYGCGLRRNEIVELNVSDVDFRNLVLHVQKGKGNQYRKIHLTEKIKEDLYRYFTEERTRLVRGKRANDAFLISSAGNRMSSSTVGVRFEEVLNKSDLQKKVTLHQLRHSIACHLLDSGMALSKVQKFLGHTFLNTTQIYTHYTKRRI